MIARFERAVQAASALIASLNTAVTEVWENPEMAMNLSGSPDDVGESCLTRRFSTSHRRAAAGLA